MARPRVGASAFAEANALRARIFIERRPQLIPGVLWTRERGRMTASGGWVGTTLSRLALAGLTTAGAAVGFGAAAIAVFTIGALGWIVGTLLVLAGATLGAWLGQRLPSAARLPRLPIIAATVLGLGAALLIQRRLTECVVGDAVMWECGEVPLIAALGAALLATFAVAPDDPQERHP